MRVQFKALLLLLLPALAWANPQVVALNSAQLEQFDGLLVDIRTPEEWQQTGVLPGAHTITFTTAESFLAEIEPYLETGKPVALICRSGNRSNRAAHALEPYLQQPIIDVDGGIQRLLRQGYQPHPYSATDAPCVGLC